MIDNAQGVKEKFTINFDTVLGLDEVRLTAKGPRIPFFSTLSAKLNGTVHSVPFFLN
jgi:hypothetical protein